MTYFDRFMQTQQSYSQIVKEYKNTQNFLIMKTNRLFFFRLSIKNETILFEEIEKIIDNQELTRNISAFLFDLINNERVSIKSLISRKLSHDIANPLTAISMNLEFIEDHINSIRNNNIEDFEFMKESVEGSIKSSNNIRDILDKYRKYNFSQAKKEICDLDYMMKFILTHLSSILPSNILIIWKSQNKLLVKMSEISFWRGLTCLIQNSLESIKNRENGLISIHTYQEKKFAIVHIEDNGEGISENVKYRVTKPLFTTKKGHLGLGLSIVEQITMDSNGEFIVESSTDNTRITWKIPVKVDDSIM